MKKTLVCLLLVFTVFGLFGCNDKQEAQHEHTYGQWQCFESGHFREYTCGCATPEILECHIDEDLNNICDKCEMILSNVNNDSVATFDAVTFFPTERSELNRDELKEAFKVYEADFPYYGEYEIYNITPVEYSEKFDIDIFQVLYEKNSLYYLKYKNDVYMVSPFAMNNENEHCITHVAITDINDDSYIEIFTAVASYSTKGRYCSSFVQITDTLTKTYMDFIDYSSINYFKKNEDGLISIYNMGTNYPVKGDITNGKLDEKYYDLATNLFETPVLNTSKYTFKERTLTASCDLYSVEITISDYSILFPYLSSKTHTPPSFKIDVKMTYLGESFSYTNGNSYLDGATVTFVNEESKILPEPVFASDVITPFYIYTGMVINSDYFYNEYLDNLNKVGIYDMVINYNNTTSNVDETIIIQDFLEITR